jgi:tetratricopeptide (TPR) repeat protein
MKIIMKRSISLIVVVLLILISLSACSKNDTAPNPENKEVSLENKQQESKGKTNRNYLFLVRKDRKYGLYNPESGWLVEPEYEYIGPFSEERAVVKKDDRYGYIDKSGRLVIDVIFDFAQDFSEGLAAVRFNGKYGYIDKDGNFVIEPQYEHAGSFSEGVAKVEPPNELWSYISKDGKTVLETDYALVGDFHDGLAYVQVSYTYGYIDKRGKMVIEPKTPGYTQDLPPYDFSEGFGIMKIEKEDDTIVRVFVDKNGEILGGLEFNIAYPFSEGLAYADGGYIDQTGRYVLTEADLPPDSRFSRGGKLFFELKRYEEAVKVYEKLVSRNPDDLNYRYKLACAYGLNNEQEKSIEILEDINKKTPGMLYIVKKLGHAYDQRKDFRKARAYFNYAIRLDPNDMLIRSRLEEYNKYLNYLSY